MFFSPKALLGVLTFLEELVAVARTPRFRGEAAEAAGAAGAAGKVPQGSLKISL